MADAAPLRLGGMALANGLLVHGPTSWAVAIRAADGSDIRPTVVDATTSDVASVLGLVPQRATA